jgi:hypothetical protein
MQNLLLKLKNSKLSLAIACLSFAGSLRLSIPGFGWSGIGVRWLLLLLLYGHH